MKYLKGQCQKIIFYLSSTNELIVIILCLFFLTACPSVQVLDTNIPGTKIVIAPECIGYLHTDSQIEVLECYDYDLKAMRVLAEHHDLYMEEGRMVIIRYVEDNDTILEVGAREGWIRRED